MIPLETVLADRYRLVRFIARGGMGEVYEAHDQALDKRIALKTLTSCANQEEQLQQLRAEVELAHRVTHKYVCRTFDLGLHRHESGAQTPFLTMELIVGRSLSERIRAEGSIPVAEACSIGLFILEGLEAAHESGVLHRDLKSDNVMLRDDRGEESFPVLMDFGLSKSLTANSTSANDGQTLAGTLAYMAPEQLQGKRPRVTTDLYAFGTVMFEMVTGRLPFLAPTPALQAIRRLQESAPSLREYSDVSPELARFVALCLEQDPRARPGSAREAHHSLRHVPDLQQNPSKARRSSRETLPSDNHLLAASAPTIRIVGNSADDVTFTSHTARRSNSEDITGPPTIVAMDEKNGGSRRASPGEQELSSVRRDWAKALPRRLGAVLLVAASAAIVWAIQWASHPARTAPLSRAIYAAATLPGPPILPVVPPLESATQQFPAPQPTSKHSAQLSSPTATIAPNSPPRAVAARVPTKSPTRSVHLEGMSESTSSTSSPPFEPSPRDHLDPAHRLSAPSPKPRTCPRGMLCPRGLADSQ